MIYLINFDMIKKCWSCLNTDTDIIQELVQPYTEKYTDASVGEKFCAAVHGEIRR